MPTVVNGTRISFIVPYEGKGKLFYYRPTRFNLNPPTAEVRETELVFNFEYTNLEIKTVPAEFKRKLEDTKDYLNWIEVDVNSFNNDLEGLIKSRIEASKNRILEVRGIVESLGFPLRSRQGIATTYMAPQVRRRIVPKLPPAPRASFAPEPTLEIEEYERILSTIYNMVLGIERSPSAFRYIQEEDIRCQFLVPLNGLYEGQATGETFNSQGKTDILIRVNDKNIFIAECKFWNGPKKLKDAIDQLLGYTTWRDCKTALLIFNRSRSLTTVLSKIPEVVRSHQCYKRQIDYDSETGFRFVLARPDDVNREIILTILVFEMPQ
jgi:hypothetical protein